MNIITVVNNFNWGDVAFNPSAPIDEASARVNTTAFSFTRAFNLAGRSANFGVVVPVVGGHVEGLYLGEPAEVDRFGLGNPRIRVAMNLYGAPSMTPQQFASYQHRTIVGVSVTVAPPLGQYRFGEADQPWYQSLVLQTGSRSVARLWQVDRGGDGRRLVFH